MSTQLDSDVIAEARDLGYEGGELTEAVLILCLDGYEDDRESLSGSEALCLLDRWIVRLFDGDRDDGTATVQAFSDADEARADFDAATRKEVI